MEKEFVPHEVALRLKALGFDEPCLGYRDGGGNLMIQHTPHCVISAPTFSQAFRWFRKKYRIDSAIIKHTGFKSNPYTLDIVRNNKDYYHDYDNDEDLILYIEYEEAELACLEKLIEIVESKKE